MQSNLMSLLVVNKFLQGQGLSAKQCEICDFFVYIPQYGCGTASLNVTVAASIVLHQFGGKTLFLLVDILISLLPLWACICSLFC